MRTILINLCFMLLFLTAKSQNWQTGRFYDVKGNMSAGLIRFGAGGRGPIKDEAFIEYKEDAKAEEMKLSASDLRSFVAGRDSFIIAASGAWSANQLDFVQVVVDGPQRLFVVRGGGGGGSSGGSGFKPGISIGAGGGTGGGGGFGGGVGGGVSIPIFGGGGGGGGSRGGKAAFFYGENTASMKPITDENFVDVMSEIMGDEPDVVEKIQLKKFSPRSMDKLINYFRQVQAGRKD
jgi:hypothetical protein